MRVRGPANATGDGFLGPSKGDMVMRASFRFFAVLGGIGLGVSLSHWAYGAPINPSVIKNVPAEGRLMYAPWYGGAWNAARQSVYGYPYGRIAYAPNVMPYAGMNPYASGYAAESSYPGYAGSNSYQQAYNVPQGSSMRSRSGLPEVSKEEKLLEGLGAKGVLEWPLGLRILPPGPETEELRNEVDTLVKLAVLEAAQGKVRPKTVSQVERDLKKLRRLLYRNADRLVVPPSTIREAKRFLSRLRRFVEAL